MFNPLQRKSTLVIRASEATIRDARRIVLEVIWRIAKRGERVYYDSFLTGNPLIDNQVSFDLFAISTNSADPIKIDNEGKRFRCRYRYGTDQQGLYWCRHYWYRWSEQRDSMTPDYILLMATGDYVNLEVSELQSEPASIALPVTNGHYHVDATPELSHLEVCCCPVCQCVSRLTVPVRDEMRILETCCCPVCQCLPE